MALVTSVSIVARAWVAHKTFLAREAKYRRKGPASPDAGPIFITLVLWESAWKALSNGTKIMKIGPASTSKIAKKLLYYCVCNHYTNLKIQINLSIVIM
jgi:hypothetical protein